MLLQQASAAAAAAAAGGAGAAASAAAPAAAATAAARQLQQRPAFSSSAAPGEKRITATLFPGDGIGPDIAVAVREIFEAAKVPVDWDEQHLSKTVDERTNSFVTRENLDSVLVGLAGLAGRGAAGARGGGVRLGFVVVVGGCGCGGG